MCSSRVCFESLNNSYLITIGLSMWSSCIIISIILDCRTNRIRALEAEKEELLIETQGLMAHSSEAQKELSLAISRQEDLKLSKSKLVDDIDTIKAGHNKLIDEMYVELKRKDDELLRYATVEIKLAEEVARLELAAQESKKHFNQQTMAMTADMKALADDIGEIMR